MLSDDRPVEPLSYLFVPGDRPDRFQKAEASDADVIILDLEDAVKPAAKAAAREYVREWFLGGGRGALRINAAGTEWHSKDAELLSLPGIKAVMVPKAEEREILAQFVSALPRGLPVIPLVETALGVWNARELASVECVARLAFGSADFQLDTGAEADSQTLLYARSRLVLASTIACIASPIDGVTLAFDDDAQLRADIATAKALGFGAKLCIHPRQVQHIRDGFRPSMESQAWAKHVLDAVSASDPGAIAVDGKLVDLPEVERARRIAARSR